MSKPNNNNKFEEAIKAMLSDIENIQGFVSGEILKYTQSKGVLPLTTENDCSKEKRKTNMIRVYQSTQNRTKNICKARSTCIDTHNSPGLIFAPNRQKRVDNWGKRSKCNWHKNHPDIYHPYLIHHRKSDK